MREADDACFADAAIYVDTREALAKSGDLLGPIARGVFSAGDVRGTLEDLARGRVAGRRSPAERTVFKSVGSALADLAAAMLVYRSVDRRRDRHDDRRRASRRFGLAPSRSPLRRAITAACRRAETEAVPPLLAEARMSPAQARRQPSGWPRAWRKRCASGRPRPAAPAWSRACSRNTRCRRRKAWR